MSPCPPRANLERFVSGEVSGAEFEPLEAHIEGCATCQGTLDELTRRDDLAWHLPGVEARRRVAAGRRGGPRLPGFRLEGEGRRGGHGVVYRAVELALGRVVAVKVVRDELLAEPAARARLASEARAVARLAHPNVVTLHGLVAADGHDALVMEWAAGGPLSDRLDGTPLGVDEAARLVEALAGGVAYAHACGVLHRDIKPGNILLPGPDLSAPKLADFGLAKLCEEGGDSGHSAAVLGTPSYMAPELAAGGLGIAGPAADVYSLGAVLYELLTGRPPFRAATPFETLVLVRDAPPVPPRAVRPTLPRDLETICLKCLEKRPGARYPTAEALRDDLRRFLRREPIAARPVGPAGRLARWCRRRPAVAALAVLLAASLLAGSAAVAASWRQAQLRQEEAREALSLYAPLAKQLYRNRLDLPETDRAALDRALELTLRVLSGSAGEPAQEHRAAFAALEIANVLHNVGELGRAEAVARESLAVLKRLAGDHPETPRFRYDYAQGCAQLATTIEGAGLGDEALALREEAIRLGEALVARHPDRYGFRSSLACWRHELAKQIAGRGERDRAEALHRLGAAELRRLVAEHPDDALLRVYLDASYGQFGEFLLGPRDDLDGYVALMEQYVAMCEATLASDLPRRAELVGPYLGAGYQLAVVLGHAGRDAESAAMLERTLATCRAVIPRLPGRAEPRATASNCAIELGLRRRGREPAEAGARFREALGYLESLASESPGASHRTNLARLLAICPDPSIRDAGRALSLARQIAAEAPGDPTARETLALCLIEEGRDDRAMLVLAGGIAPTDRPRGVDAEGDAYLAVLLWKAGRHGEAREAYRSATGLLRRPLHDTHRHRRAWQLARDLVEAADPTPRGR